MNSGRGSGLARSLEDDMTQQGKTRGRPRKVVEDAPVEMARTVKAPAVAKPSMTRAIIEKSGLDPRPYGRAVRD